jgi:hypothetical protein
VLLRFIKPFDLRFFMTVLPRAILHLESNPHLPCADEVNSVEVKRGLATGGWGRNRPRILVRRPQLNFAKT